MPPLLPAPQRRLLGAIALVVLSLTLYSSHYGLSSQPAPSPAQALASLNGDELLPSAWAESMADRGYFARKSNLFNQWCVLTSCNPRWRRRHHLGRLTARR
jgi:hypothetical protein